MANEWLITHEVRLVNGSLTYRPGKTEFRADQAAARGPVPGFLLIGTAGEDVTFTDLTTPGIVVIKNLDDTNYVEYGIWDDPTFYPFGEVLPGEEWIMRLSRNIGTFRVRANTAECEGQILAFDS